MNIDTTEIFLAPRRIHIVYGTKHQIYKALHWGWEERKPEGWHTPYCTADDPLVQMWGEKHSYSYRARGDFGYSLEDLQKTRKALEAICESEEYRPHAKEECRAAVEIIDVAIGMFSGRS